MTRTVHRFFGVAVPVALIVACSTGTEPPVLLVDLDADTAFVFLGDSIHLDLVAVRANGDTVPNQQVQLSSTDSTVAIMGADGWVHGLAQGFATIRASSGPADDTVSVTVMPHLTFTSISAGSYYTCGVTDNGDGYCWGTNGVGQLGTGDSTSRLLPTRVVGGLKFSRIETGIYHTCGITVSSAAYCWGMGNGGQLGMVAQFGSPVPLQVSGGLTFASIDLGEAHTCALTGTGVVYCWGADNEGQLGDGGPWGSGLSSVTPTAVAGGLAFRSLGAGDHHSCGVTVDSIAYCWGRNNHGQTGDSTTVDPRTSPVPVHGGLKFLRVVASSHGYACGIVPGDTAYCWGHNDDYQLGRSPAAGTDLPVLPVSGGIPLMQVAGGGLVACGLTPGGAAYCWGASYLLGYPGAAGGYSDVPLLVGGGMSFTSIGVYSSHACGMANDGRAYCWGRNSGGELGIGRTSTIEATPVPVIGQP